MIIRVIEILTPAEVDKGRATGALVGTILQTLRERTRVGTNLLEIDRWAKQMIEAAGADSCYVDYAPSFGRGPFGHHICTAVNDAVLHGLPHDRVLQDGDLLTLDLAVSLDGIAADAAISFVVGTARPEDLALIDATERALAAGIAAAGPGARIGDLSHAIGTVLEAAGYPVNVEFGGHGIGSTMHQDPHVSNTGRPGRGYTLRPGLLLALEPWVMADTDVLVTDADGWTLRSATGARTAHTEHTIAITEDGAEVLTLPADRPDDLDGQVTRRNHEHHIWRGVQHGERLFDTLEPGGTGGHVDLHRERVDAQPASVAFQHRFLRRPRCREERRVSVSPEQLPRGEGVERRSGDPRDPFDVDAECRRSDREGDDARCARQAHADRDARDGRPRTTVVGPLAVWTDAPRVHGDRLDAGRRRDGGDQGLPVVRAVSSRRPERHRDGLEARPTNRGSARWSCGRAQSGSGVRQRDERDVHGAVLPLGAGRLANSSAQDLVTAIVLAHETDHTRRRSRHPVVAVLERDDLGARGAFHRSSPSVHPRTVAPAYPGTGDKTSTGSTVRSVPPESVRGPAWPG